LISTFQIPTNIQEDINLVENLMLSQADNYHQDLKSALKVLLSSGGKRIRPVIILLVGDMLHGKKKTLLNLATAIELLHTATLVHDDLIDGALLRRGIPTLNSKWSPAATVLTGDFLFSCSAVLAAKTNNLEVIELFSRTLTVIVNGEINQLFTSRCNTSRDDYESRIYAKTASLFETSAKSAAILSDATPQQIEALRKFGYSLGMAFQIIDDVLDYIGDVNKVGKPLGGDLRQGLITLPVLYYIQNHLDNPSINRLLEGKCITEDEEITQLVRDIAVSDAIGKSFSDAHDLVVEAQSCLDIFPDSSEKQVLLALTEYIIERNK
jgi:geranylgeranyl pyrophosphate synthase